MKKYLMTGIAALALGGIITSCSHDMDQYKGGNTTENIKKTYENAFVETFGQPAATQTWGFGSATVAGTRGGTRANPGENYPATHSYQDASGAVIAGANMNHNEWADPSKEFGGWVVPDALTEGQKLRVHLTRVGVTAVKSYKQDKCGLQAPRKPFPDGLRTGL